MKIAVVSDTHDYLLKVKEAVLQEQVDYLMFLGDHAEDGRKLAEALQVPAFIVQGNCDYSDPAPKEQLVELGGWRFFLCHGHRYGVKEDLFFLRERGRREQVDFILFGHTHQFFYEENDGVTMLNPGSVSQLNMLIGDASWVLLTLSDKKEENFFKKYEKKACQNN